MRPGDIAQWTDSKGVGREGYIESKTVVSISVKDYFGDIHVILLNNPTLNILSTESYEDILTHLKRLRREHEREMGCVGDGISNEAIRRHGRTQMAIIDKLLPLVEAMCPQVPIDPA